MQDGSTQTPIPDQTSKSIPISVGHLKEAISAHPAKNVKSAIYGGIFAVSDFLNAKARLS